MAQQQPKFKKGDYLTYVSNDNNIVFIHGMITEPRIGMSGYVISVSDPITVLSKDNQRSFKYKYEINFGYTTAIISEDCLAYDNEPRNEKTRDDLMRDSLVAFRTQYPDITSGDMQSYVLGWMEGWRQACKWRTGS